MTTRSSSSPANRLAISDAFLLIGRNFFAVVALCALSATGRFVQTGWPVFSGIVAQIGLEMIVEGSRIALALLVVGHGSLRGGVQAIRRFVRTPAAETNARFNRIPEAFHSHWKAYVKDWAIYAALAVGLNLAIPVVAELPVAKDAAFALGAVDDAGVVDTEATRLFLKNLSVIPLTIVFQFCFALRVWRDAGNDRGRVN